MSVRVFVEAPAAARLRAWCWVLFVAPFVVFVVAAAASHLLTSAPSASGDFVPTPQVMLLSVAFAALHAGVFTSLLWRLRRHLTEDFFRRRRGRSTLRESPWLLGAVLFGLVGLLGAEVFCGAINRVIGQVTFEQWRVQSKEDNLSSHGCEYRVNVASRTNDNAARVCVTRERWSQLRADDSLAIMAIFSALGAQVGLAPDANPKGAAR